MKTLQRLACVVMVAGMVTFLWAPSGMATIISDTKSITSDPDALLFDYFDSSGTTFGVDTTGATLNSVTLDFTMGIDDHIFYLANTTSSNVAGTVSYTWNVTLTSGSIPTPEIPGTVTPLSATSVTDFSLGMFGGQGYAVDGYSDSATGTVSNITTYQSTGQFTFNVDFVPDGSPDFTYTQGSEGDVTFTDFYMENFPTYGGTVKVTYDYTPAGGEPVPEPATMLLLGLGLIGLIGASRRRSMHT